MPPVFKANGVGVITIGTAGIPIQLPVIKCSRVMICASDNNLNLIVVGDNTVNASLRNGIILQPSFSQWFYPSSTNQLWVDAITSGSVFSYYYEISQ